MENWTVATRFAQKLEGVKDPTASLNQTLGRYTPDFEYHLVNLTQRSDEELRGAVITRLFMLVLKHIFEPELGGLLRRRFQPGEETLQTIAQQLTQIRQEAVLSQLVDLALDVLVLPDFMTKVQALVPATPTSS